MNEMNELQDVRPDVFKPDPFALGERKPLPRPTQKLRDALFKRTEVTHFFGLDVHEG